jgi:hypothetical protein
MFKGQERNVYGGAYVYLNFNLAGERFFVRAF